MFKILTYTYRIYPNKLQKEKIDRTFIACRVMYNKLLDSMYAIHCTYKKYLQACDRAGVTVDKEHFNSTHYVPSLPIIKERFPFLKEVDSLALCSEWHHLRRALRSFYRGKTNFPRYKGRKDKNSYTTCFVNNNIRVEGNRLRLPKVGFVKIKLHRDLPKGYKIQRVIVKEDKCGRYFAAIVIRCKSTCCPKKNLDRVVGLDFKIGEVFVSSKREIPKYPQPYRASLSRLKQFEKELGRKRKFSKNWWRCQIKIQKLHKKIANKRKDFLHQVSEILSKKYNVIAVETLSIVQIAKKLGSGTNVYDTSYCRFLAMLQYKLQRAGGQMIKISPWFPSSKKCSHCGAIDKQLKLGHRIYFCRKCFHRMDRDLNAAINIEREGLRLLCQ